MNDMQAVREAAERLMKHLPRVMAFPEKLSPAIKAMVEDQWEVTRSFLALTDPTPLTVEQLVEEGGKCVGDDAVRFGDLYFTICEVDGTIGVMVGEEHLPRKLWPRTVGHLRQLLLRMEKQ